MTIIAAAVGYDGTWIGADGLSQVQEGIIESRNYHKWNILLSSRLAFASGGPIIPSSIMRRALKETWIDEMSEGAEGVLQLGDYMRAVLLEAKEFPVDHESWKSFGYSPVVVTPGHVWRLGSDLRSVFEPIEGCYQVAGSGELIARGACHQLLRTGNPSAENLVRAAIEAACYYSIHCGGELFIERFCAPHDEEGS